MSDARGGSRRRARTPYPFNLPAPPAFYLVPLLLGLGAVAPIWLFVTDSYLGAIPDVMTGILLLPLAVGILLRWNWVRIAVIVLMALGLLLDGFILVGLWYARGLPYMALIMIFPRAAAKFWIMTYLLEDETRGLFVTDSGSVGDAADGPPA